MVDESETWEVCEVKWCLLEDEDGVSPRDLGRNNGGLSETSVCSVRPIVSLPFPRFINQVFNKRERHNVPLEVGRRHPMYHVFW